jgi:hypothetical protein
MPAIAINMQSILRIIINGEGELFSCSFMLTALISKLNYFLHELAIAVHCQWPSR